MPIRVISGADALANLKDNPAAKWPRFDEPENRLWPLASPAFHNSCTIDEGATIFTMGSCFARNVESALVDRGMSVPTTKLIAEDDYLEPPFLNLYSVASIFNEFTWALNPETPYKFDANLAEVMPGGFIDLHLANAVRPAPRETLETIRRKIISLYQGIVNADVLVVTLGLVESWWDHETKTHLNVTPPKRLIARNPDRFELHVLDYADIIDYLERAFALLRANAKPDIRVILTVSPVPLSRTFTDHDVAVANSYSKSVLRAAAEKVCTDNAFIDYFPSYESVLLSDQRRSWQVDRVHVQREIVRLNVDRMMNAYFGRSDTDSHSMNTDEGDSPDVPQKAAKSAPQPRPVPEDDGLRKLWEEFGELFDRRKFGRAAAVAEKLIAKGQSHPQLYFALAKRAATRNRWSDCREFLNGNEVSGKLQKEALALEAEAAIHTGQLDQAERIIKQRRDIIRKGNRTHHMLQAMLLDARGETGAAESEFEESLRHGPGSRRTTQLYLEFCRENNLPDKAASLEQHLKFLDSG